MINQRRQQEGSGPTRLGTQPDILKVQDFQGAKFWHLWSLAELGWHNRTLWPRAQVGAAERRALHLTRSVMLGQQKSNFRERPQRAGIGTTAPKRSSGLCTTTPQAKCSGRPRELEIVGKISLVAVPRCESLLWRGWGSALCIIIRQSITHQAHLCGQNSSTRAEWECLADVLRPCINIHDFWRSGSNSWPLRAKSSSSTPRMGRSPLKILSHPRRHREPTRQTGPTLNLPWSR